MKVLLGLGSNACFKGMSCPELLAGGIFRLSKILCEMKVSSVYESKAMYVTDQSDFYNMAVSGVIPDEMIPHELLHLINEIEAEFGRNRSLEIRFGPRSLDIDIEEFGNYKINDEDLVIPHPRMKERAFVLIPALEIFTESADENRRKELEDYLHSLSSQEVKKSSEIVQMSFHKALERYSAASEI